MECSEKRLCGIIHPFASIITSTIISIFVSFIANIRLLDSLHLSFPLEAK